MSDLVYSCDDCNRSTAGSCWRHPRSFSMPPRVVRRGDGSAVVIRELEGGAVEQLVVPAWAANSIRKQESRCHCMNPCAGGCVQARISICALCLNGVHDPNPTREFVESRSNG